MCVSMELYFTWKFPKAFIYLICTLVTLPFLFNRKFTRNTGALLVIFTLCYFYNYTHNVAFSAITFFSFAFVVIISTFLIVSSDEFKLRLLKKFDIFMKWICLISLVGWMLYLLGIPLPHYYSETSDFYNHEVYYLFIVGAYNSFDIVPRFCGMFMEPGHIGSTACLLLYVNRFNFKDKSNYIYLLSILLSLSLAAYGLLFIGVCLYFFFNGKNIIKYSFASLIFVVIFYFISVGYNKGENIINEKIVSRLEIVDGELAGNNRTSSLFDSYYENWLKKGNLFTGYGRDAYGDGKSKTNILWGCASYKRFFFVNGILGVILLFILYITFLIKYRSLQGIGFFILFIICNMIRDYPYRLMWLYLFILGCVSFTNKSMILYSFKNTKNK